MNSNQTFTDFYNYPYQTSTYDDRMADAQRYSAKRNLNGLTNLINRLFDYHSRMLVVRIDLCYQPGYSEFLQIEDVQRHLKQLIGDRRCNPVIFHGLVGYAWGLEYGAYGGGYHFHFLALFDGSVRREDIGIGMSIANLWTNITGGLGRCYISNCDKDKLSVQGCLGIGMIHRDDIQLRKNLIERVAAYITKRCSEFEIDTANTASGDFRTFGKSQMPPPLDPNVSRRGRPPVSRGYGL
ncbi:hypothetical protein MIZ03_3962 [Rhodoferax lithotrophicus]|uniref:Inovirus Gp2 family protein n=1 Tax=Rhodoferax lithotrophicus TaxID=2798804 RepID=A0ABM7MRR9_9BURK|nr:inovirus-type Gp2 protein [Rhodoferax sp. MIZ03]BCO29051.1 hypothetical protein MIZ03_3962 [Rhodoferax sp. MIZ03]